MFKFIKDDGSAVVLETRRGRFVLTASADSDYPGIYVDYQEPGKPTHNLAVIEHYLEDDELRTLGWENSDADDFSYSHILQHKNRENIELQSLEQAIKKFNDTHAGLELEARLLDNKDLYTLDLGYWGIDCNFYALQRLNISCVYLEDIIYCVEYHGWKFVQE